MNTKSRSTRSQTLRLLALFLVIPVAGFAANDFQLAEHGWHIAGIRFEFPVFILTLIGIAVYHRLALPIAATGLAALLVIRLMSTPFDPVEHISHEWEILVNLLGLLLGFAILAKLFESSGIPDRIPVLLPENWTGPFLLLLMVFLMSAFLDNIAAALIGGSVAMVIFRQNVHIGYVAALVAASNAGGSGSVVGDTTTTMMWIDGVEVGQLVPAYIAAIPAFLVLGIPASIQQFRIQPSLKPHSRKESPVNWKYLLTCILILIGAVSTNILLDFPAVGVWTAILIGALFIPIPWSEAKSSFQGSLFLLAVVGCASLMPVEELPFPSWGSTFFLGLISSFFDNIPLTKLALDQSNYDWSLLAYAVGFGGSLTWFGSSAGVAITNLFPKGRNLKLWVTGGWYLILAYAVGFFCLLLLKGWHPVVHI